MNPLYVSSSEAIQLIKSGFRIFVHGGAATPNALLSELVLQASRLKNVSLIHLHTMGPALYAQVDLKNSFQVINLFVGENMRQQMNYEQVDYLPCFISEIPELFRSKQRPIDVALIQVSPPDRFGFCSLGVSVDVAKAAVNSAEMVIAQVNSKMPRVHGDGFIHISKFKAIVEANQELPETIQQAPDNCEIAIAKNISELVEDGSTLQMGIGSIPDAVTRNLSGHKDLGIHTEMWSDGTLKLIESGVVTNSKKNVHRGKSVSSFLILRFHLTTSQYEYLNLYVHLDFE